jgi:hypothetical protein
MRSTLLAAILLGLIVLAAAHGHHGKDKGSHHGKHDGKKHHKPACSYKDTNGHSFDLSRLKEYERLYKNSSLNLRLDVAKKWFASHY